MGRERQKKKNRSSIPKVKHNRKQLSSGKKKINVLGNPVVAANWYEPMIRQEETGLLTVLCISRDRSLTLAQNYRRLGLTSRLNASTGGIEKPNATPSTSHFSSDTITRIPIDSLSIPATNKAASSLLLTEARVERDPKTGRILRVIRPEGEDEELIAGRKRRKHNPLYDPLNELTGADDSEGEVVTTGPEDTSDVKALEAQAAQEGHDGVRKKQPRHQSKREQEWIERLVEKYGDDVRAMAWDKKLNPMQQSEGDLRRRVGSWRETRR